MDLKEAKLLTDGKKLIIEADGQKYGLGISVGPGDYGELVMFPIFGNQY